MPYLSGGKINKAKRKPADRVNGDGLSGAVVRDFRITQDAALTGLRWLGEFRLPRPEPADKRQVGDFCPDARLSATVSSRWSGGAPHWSVTALPYGVGKENPSTYTGFAVTLL